MVKRYLYPLYALVAAVPMFIADPSFASERPGGGPPPNDSCSAVTPEALAVGGSLNFTGDNTEATFGGDATNGILFDFPFENTWHAFTTTECADVEVNYCGTTDGWSNVWRLLSTQCPADSLSIVPATSFDTTSCPNGNWTFRFLSLPAGTYYLPVLNDQFFSEGVYDITVSATVCGGNAPANDFCSSVTPEALAIGSPLTFIGNTTNATDSLDAEPGTTLFGYESVWHAFTTTECADVILSYCGLGTVWPNVWHLLATTCPATDDVVNATSFNTTDCGDGNQTVVFAGLPAGTYYMPVFNDGFNFGAYSITVTALVCGGSAPVNDFCSSVTPEALAIGSPLTFTGNTSNATDSLDAVEGTPMDGYASVWHAFTLDDCANVTLSYCGLGVVWPNVWHLLATSCPADSNLINATGFNTEDCGDGNQTVFFAALPAGTYYVPIFNDGFNFGPYSVTATATACGTGVPPNDLCGDVAPEILGMGSSVTFNGDNTNATLPGDAEPGTLIGSFGLGSVWHVFTIAECADVTIDYCGTTPPFTTEWNLIATTCPANDSLVYASVHDTTLCGDGNSTDFYDDLPAGTYYVPVLNNPFVQDEHPYTLTISAVQCDSISCDGGLVSGNGASDVTVCINLGPAVITFSANSTSVESYSYILTDNADNIVNVLAADELDGADLTEGVYHVYGVSYSGTLTGVGAGQPISGVGSDGACADVSSNFVTVTAEICGGVSENNADGFSVFPNPTNGDLSLNYSGPTATATVQLLDPLGRVVRTMPITLAAGRTIQVTRSGDLSPGAYVMRIATHTSTVERTVIVR
jgi:hypothetical protein